MKSLTLSLGTNAISAMIAMMKMALNACFLMFVLKLSSNSRPKMHFCQS
jgi:hypothetical protein